MTEVAPSHHQLQTSKLFTSSVLRESLGSASTPSLASSSSDSSLASSPTASENHEKEVFVEVKKPRAAEAVERRVGGCIGYSETSNQAHFSGEGIEQSRVRQTGTYRPPNRAVLAALSSSGSDPEKRGFRRNSNSTHEIARSRTVISPRQRTTVPSNGNGTSNTSSDALKRTLAPVRTAKLIRPAPLKKRCDVSKIVAETIAPSTIAPIRPVTGKNRSTVSVFNDKTEKPLFASARQQRLKAQQQLQLEKRQKEAERLKQQKLEEETKKRQEAQCTFPVKVHPQLIERPLLMGSSERNNVQQKSSQVQIMTPQHDHPTVPYRHHQQQRPQVRSGSNATSSAGSPTNKQQLNVHIGGNEATNGGDMESSAPPTPLFERLVSEEVQELKTYARIIESQNRRVADLERIHDDLEARLEMQTKERMELEARLEEQNRMWAAKCASLEKERDSSKSLVQSERMKNERLLDQVNRKDKEIHRMIQRKYDAAKNPHQQQHHGPGHVKRSESSRNQQANTSLGKIGYSSMNNLNGHGKFMQHKSPHEILVQSGTGEAVRERNVASSLLDFFGM